jgi:hypothetical protein
MAGLEEEGVEEHQLADTSDTIDGIVFDGIVSLNLSREVDAYIPVTSETLSGARVRASAVW